MRLFRIVDSNGSSEEWADDMDAADGAVARRLGVPPEQVVSIRRPITVDPVVVRRGDGRWRSRQAWSARAGSTTLRVYEMLHIDEAQYDH